VAAARDYLTRSQSNFVRKAHASNKLAQVSEELEEDDDGARVSGPAANKEPRQLAMSMKQMRPPSKTGQIDNFME